jgi:uncharacterized protein (DUF427 family)/uncharacterized YccA/Bax inhibitor family protein
MFPGIDAPEETLLRGATARLNGTVLAVTEDPLPKIDGMVFFPKSCVRFRHLRRSGHTTSCHNKGNCFYWDVIRTGTGGNAPAKPAAAFAYEDDNTWPSVKGRVGFWCGAEITDHATQRTSITMTPKDYDTNNVYCGQPGSKNACNQSVLKPSNKEQPCNVKYCRELAGRVPASVGGIALNLIALKTWSSIVRWLWYRMDAGGSTRTNSTRSNNTGSGVTHDDIDNILAQNPVALQILQFCLVAVCTILLLLAVLKLFLAHQQVVQELRKPPSCGAIGALLMACSLLSSETQLCHHPTTTQALLLFFGVLQICLIPWFVWRLVALRKLPIPSAFPATVGVGMLCIASSGAVEFMPLWWIMLGATISGVCVLVFFPVVLANVLCNPSVSASPGIFILSAPIPLLSLCHYSVFMTPIKSAADSCRTSTSAPWPCLVSHALFALSTIALCLTGFMAWQRRSSIQRGFYRASTAAFIHHADAGVTFPLVAYSSSTILYTLRVHGRNAFDVHENPIGLIAWSWVTVVVTAVVVGVTDVMFLVFLPSWIRFGLPPTFIGQPEQCHVDTSELKLIELRELRDKQFKVIEI